VGFVCKLVGLCLEELVDCANFRMTTLCVKIGFIDGKMEFCA